ncbi:COG3772 Phage-related lysozyme (muraminidase) [uncultured Caudovirales phage]|uniref:Endolysin n=1 Tax=uncultured Caudovirales phage TaxID=2100421 RepID=A0A6J7W7Z6_9CAUD|nr:COG3772 Phage-related lysozyme (muraminidase) [uncultured Caudovirales phage]
MTITVTAWQPLAEGLIRQFEGCKLKAYLCPAGVPTLGWGATGPDIHLGMNWTQDQADARLLADLQCFGDQVAALVKAASTTAHQFAALTSFHYNTGELGHSTLLRMHLAGDYAGAKAEFQKWNKARVNGELVPLGGLTKRRAAEAALYGKADV